MTALRKITVHGSGVPPHEGFETWLEADIWARANCAGEWWLEG